MTHPSDETLNDYIERELGPAEQVRVATHVETCGECARAVAEIQQVIHEAAALGPITPPPQVWTSIQARLQGQEARGERPEAGGESLEAGGERREARGGRRRARGDERWRRLVWLAATAALVVMAFLTGRFVNLRERQSASQQTAPAGARPTNAQDAIVRERVLLIAVGDHLERSQMVLVELAHAETRGDLDISSERQLADDLVASNRLYRQTAQQMGQANVAGLLDELERVLVEVARGPSTVSMRQLTDIQQRIESQGILFKIKVVGSEIRKQPVS